MTKAETLLQEQSRLASVRSVFEQDWRDIRDLVRPMTGEFNPYGPSYAPAKRNAEMYDGTAVDACEELASGLHSFLTNPVERWLELEAEGIVNPDLDTLTWLEDTSEILYSAFNDERARFNSSIHETFLDVSAFGTGIFNVEWAKRRHLRFHSHPLADCWVKYDSENALDTVVRRVRWTRNQVAQEFGEANLPPKLLAIDGNKDVEVYHFVMPRTDPQFGSFAPTQMRFGSYWVCKTTGEMINESGYRSMPYMAPNWMQLSGEMYGKGPAHVCLPDVKMLNQMELTILKAAEKAVDPPLQVPDEGFLADIATSPGSIMYKEPGAENIEPLVTGAQIPLGLELSNQKRQFIQKCFHMDWLIREKKRERQTQFEVADERDEMLRQMSPMLGRMESELLGPMVKRVFELLDFHGLIPPAPPALQGRKVKPSYTSPAARAQQGVKSQTMGRFVQDLSVVAAFDPTVTDAFDSDAYAQEQARIRMVPRTVVRTPEQIAQIRQDRAEQEQMAQAAAAAEPVSKAAKNFAQANEIGGNVTAPLP